MTIFTLTPTYFIEDDLEANVCLKPDSPLINEYIATYRVFSNEEEALLMMSEYINEMTPLLFNDFQNMENIPLEIRNEFYLP